VMIIITTNFSVPVCLFFILLFVCEVFWLINSSSAYSFVRSFFSLSLSLSFHSHVFLFFFFFFLFALEDRSLISLCYALVPFFFFTITSVGSFNRTSRHAMNVVGSVRIRIKTPHIYQEHNNIKIFILRLSMKKGKINLFPRVQSDCLTKVRYKKHI
jgi:hypothetical protein